MVGFLGCAVNIGGCHLNTGHKSAIRFEEGFAEEIEEQDEIDVVAYSEPEPEGYDQIFTVSSKDSSSVTLPRYNDDMPLFERAQAWTEGEVRSYVTPLGVQALDQGEAYDMYRDAAEATTGETIDETPGLRTVIGIRGATPGSFEWHDNTPNLYNDTLVLMWIDEDDLQPRVREFPVTTEMGDHNFGRNSSSSLMPNRRYDYVNGWHKNYNALQMAEWSYRVRDDSNHNGHWDDDRNGWMPPTATSDRWRTGSGHNIHMGKADAPLESVPVDNRSAGCQVIPGRANWLEFLDYAWTGLGDEVSYYLLDTRDIPMSAWGYCEPDGTHLCPFPIELGSYSETIDGDTSSAVDDTFDVYNCSSSDQSGPEVVYVINVDTYGTLSVDVDCPEGVDIDVHLLSGDDDMACLERGHHGFDYSIAPGRYLIIADSWVNSDGESQEGEYELTVSLD